MNLLGQYTKGNKVVFFTVVVETAPTDTRAQNPCRANLSRGVMNGRRTLVPANIASSSFP